MIKRGGVNQEITEDRNQKLIITWTKHRFYDGKPIADYLHHSPNGGKRASKVSSSGKRYSPEAAKLKAMGTKAGWPDLQLCIASGGYHGLYIELKRGRAPNSKGLDIEVIKDGIKPKLSKATDQQVANITMLNNQGYLAVVAYGYSAAIDLINDYLKGSVKL